MKRIISIFTLLVLINCSLFEEDNDDGLPNGWNKIDELRGGLVTSFFPDEDGLYIGTQSFGVQFSDYSLEYWKDINDGIDYIDHDFTPTLDRKTVTDFTKKDGQIYIGIETSVSVGGYEGTESEFVGGLYRLNVTKDSWEYIGFKELNIQDISIIDNSFILCTGDSIYILEENIGGWGKKVISTIDMPGAYSNAILEDIIFIPGRRGIFLSDDLGLNWQYTIVSTNTYINFIDKFENKLIVGTNNGIYISEDLAKSWSQVNDGIPYEHSTGYANINRIASNDSIIVAIYYHYTYLFEGRYDDIPHQISTGIIYKKINETKWTVVEFQGKSGNKIGYPIFPREIEIVNDQILVSIAKSGSIGSTNNEVWVNSKILKN